MAREHEAGKSSLMEILRFAKRERDTIIKKMDEMKSKTLLQRDRQTLSKLLDTFESDFESSWRERKKSLTKHAKFCLFTNSLRGLNQDMHELQETVKMKTTPGETMSSVQGAEQYLGSIQGTVNELEQRLKLCSSEGNQLIKEMPVHATTIQMSLNQAQDNWKNLQDMIKSKRTQLSSAKEYFKLLEETERFLSEANKSLLSWSRRISTLSNTKDAMNLKAEIERYIKMHKQEQNDKYYKISGKANEGFGQQVFNKTQVVQREQNETFDALTTLLAQIDNFLSHRKSLDADEARNKRIQAETEANIRAAKAEAESARRAAKQAEEARRAAEEATIKAMEEVRSTRLITQTEITRTQEEQQKSVAPLFTQYLQDIVTKEGSRCEMRAKVSGLPEPQITWFKDGVPVQSNTDYKSSFNDGQCRLLIEETFVEDSANWSVRASNQAGYAESHAKLTVQEIKPVEELEQPKIVQALQDGNVTEGNSYVFGCQISGKPEPQVSWYKNDTCVDKSRLYQISSSSGNYSLKIIKCALNDQAQFSLRATNNVGYASSGANLKVKPLQPTELPEFDEPLCNMDVITGQSLALECQVNGLPKPELQWYHNNKLLRNSSDTQISYNGQKATLRVRHAFPKAGGQYICKAKNTAGEASSTCIVTVKSIQPETSDSEAIEPEPVKQESKPAFYVPLRNLEVTEDEEAILECVVVANPEAEVAWYRNNMPVKDAGNVRFLKKGDTWRLVIAKATEAQMGEYKARAINKLGESHSTCRVKVNPKKRLSAIATQTSIDESQESTEISYFAESSVKTKPKKMVAPKFLVNVQSQEAEEGSNIVLEAMISGVPEPKVTWLHNGQMVQLGPNLQIQMADRKTALYIMKVCFICVWYPEVY